MINENFARMEKNYLFAEVAQRVADYKNAHPGCDIISMGIGDVTRPLAPTVVEALRKAAAEMGCAETFRGYGPYEGYAFLRDAVSDYYKGRGADVSAKDIFIGDGAKNDLGAILDLFAPGATAIIPDPVYPAYVDASVIAGNRILYAAGSPDNGFLPAPPREGADLVYLCSPNNPTGAVYTKDGLRAWVEYANGCGAVLLFDAAYERFISNASLPHSIYEIDGAERCAIEFCSFSKTAGFTGVRCGWTVVPKTLVRDGQNLRELWARRAAAKYNGTSYIVQRGAQAVFSPQGALEIDANIDYYKTNAALLGAALAAAGIRYFGAEHSPYLWFDCAGRASWDVFGLLLDKAKVVCTPGAGFGSHGEGYCRLTAFGTRENTERAAGRITAALSNQF
ncbi:MAG: LL-diaminopimelate aminotransferase [Oscillospiraceae bacterium]|nr:LL-diaminopimelate aminotransferase [Oscillospiraceae bacterium]